MKKAFVILNTAAGTLAKAEAGKPADTICGAFAARNIPCDIREVDGPGVKNAIDEALASDADVVLAGGGDGTLNSIASALVNTDKAFAVLQLGTLNHLAKELNTPPDLGECVNALIDGEIAPMPVGRVNDRYFLLFSALGLYAYVIKHRDAQRKSLGRSKWPAMAVATVKLLRKFRRWKIVLRLPEVTLKRYTPTTYVALSEYQETLLGLHESGQETGRSTLRIHLTRATGRIGFVMTLLSGLVRRSRGTKHFETILADQFEIDLHEKIVRVGLDGEIVDLVPPLKYSRLATGLNVVRPRQ